MRDEQILGVVGTTGQIGKNTQCRTNQYRWHDRQAIKAVGQVDGVAGADNHEIRQGNETPHAERIADGLEERYDQIGLRRQIHAETGLHPADKQFQHLHVGAFGD